MPTVKSDQPQNNPNVVGLKISSEPLLYEAGVGDQDRIDLVEGLKAGSFSNQNIERIMGLYFQNQLSFAEVKLLGNIGPNNPLSVAFADIGTGLGATAFAGLLPSIFSAASPALLKAFAAAALPVTETVIGGGSIAFLEVLGITGTATQALTAAPLLVIAGNDIYSWSGRRIVSQISTDRQAETAGVWI